MKKFALPIILIGIILVLGAVLTGVLIFLKNQPPQTRTFQPVTEVKALEPDSSVWGLNYPNQYASLIKTADNDTPTAYGGSNQVSYLETDPRLVILFAGYPFGRDYSSAPRPRERRPGRPRHQAPYPHHRRHLLLLQILRQPPPVGPRWAWKPTTPSCSPT